MRSREEVAERRRSLRLGLVAAALLLISLSISFVLRVSDGEWTPWGLLILVLFVAALGNFALGVFRLRQLSRLGEPRQVNDGAN